MAPSTADRSGAHPGERPDPNAFPPRLHVLLAREAPLGVVIRRGPSRHVCTLLWERTRDQFRLGQWFKGRIYERRSDLSTDGQYLIYFAMDGRWHAEARGAWTAISYAPYLKAVALFPKGDCWHGGGLFTGRSSYWLNDGCGHSVLHATRQVRRDHRYQPPQYFGGECPGVYYPRLLRDGWELVEQVPVSDWRHLDIFTRPVGAGWTLRKIAHSEVNHPVGRGCYWDEHELVHAGIGVTVRYTDWEWADLDRDRLVWASRGKLFAGRIDTGGLTGVTELYDFNGMTFEAIPAPY